MVIEEEDGSEKGYDKLDKERKRRKYLKKISGISSITMCEEEMHTVTEFSINNNLSSDPSLFYSEVYKLNRDLKGKSQGK